MADPSQRPPATINSVEKWQRVNVYGLTTFQLQSRATCHLNAMFRLPVPGGWLVTMCDNVTGSPSSPSFYPDPQHDWLKEQPST